ncbi:MAG TPA: glycosyltransferase family 2 protein [Syntrophomonadaceae bacterium]|nr:glycosyltransferase family 2 protein [Syntrophomonadaceae bacterium]
MHKTVDFSVVIPVYNEEEVIYQTYCRLKQVMNAAPGSYELIFVDDGSTDASREILRGLSEQDGDVRLLVFSRNFGHQAAISAGMDYAEGRAIVVIDADLQDPPEVVLEMIKKWKEGYDVVYGKRIKREGETFFKKATAAVFYRLLRRLAGYDLPPDVGDFRLIDRKVCDALKGFREKSRYLRGLISWMGFRQGEVEYVRERRQAGVTKYTLEKMLKLAFDAIASFSYKPLKAASYLGVFLCFAGLVFPVVLINLRFFAGVAVGGWVYLGAINLFFNGVLLIALGIMGEYIGRIYEEAKDRPLYIVADQAGFSRGAVSRGKEHRAVPGERRGFSRVK